MSDYKNLKDYRHINDLSQKELSERTGVTQQHISGIERGERTLVPSQAKLFAKHLSSTGEKLFKNHVLNVLNKRTKELKESVEELQTREVNDSEEMTRLWWATKKRFINKIWHHFKSVLKANGEWPDQKDLHFCNDPIQELYDKYLNQLEICENNFKNQLKKSSISPEEIEQNLDDIEVHIDGKDQN